MCKNINTFLPQVYNLKNKIQHYDWGTKNENAFIPKLLGIKPGKNIPYAELWIGAHPKLPSEILINGKYYPLNKVIEKFPKEILGHRVSRKFKNKLPFLLKVLSTEKALSIQAHPNKQQAKILYENDNKNYYDKNHKPEIAIAIDSFKLAVGFKPFNEVIKTLNKYSVLRDHLNLNKIKKHKTKSKALKEIYTALMSISEKELEVIVPAITKQIKEKKNKTEEEKNFIELQKEYGNDIGMLTILILNNINLNRNSSVFTSAGIPHVYFKGNIIECMSNSDNVVRAGLTGKFKDVQTLLKILNYNAKKIRIVQNNKDVFRYPSAADEFVITMYNLAGGRLIRRFNKSVTVILVLNGKININWGKYKKETKTIGKGESVLIPANISYYKIENKYKAKYAEVKVP